MSCGDVGRRHLAVAVQIGIARVDFLEDRRR